MNKANSRQDKKIVSIFIRYILIILLGLFNLRLIYMIFKPLTVYGPYVLLSIFSNPSVLDSTIVLGSTNFEIINACVVGAAYYLLLILFLSFQNLKLKTRVYALLASFGLIYVFNILRISLLVLVANQSYFDSLHWLFWNFLSTAFVVLIFVFTIRKFKIRGVPFKDDVMYLWELANKPKRQKSRK